MDYTEGRGGKGRGGREGERGKRRAIYLLRDMSSAHVPINLLEDADLHELRVQSFPEIIRVLGQVSSEGEREGKESLSSLPALRFGVRRSLSPPRGVALAW
jgi:hypothetical protein